MQCVLNRSGNSNHFTIISTDKHVVIAIPMLLHGGTEINILLLVCVLVELALFGYPLQL
jgi:hypothetical protein